MPPPSTARRIRRRRNPASGLRRDEPGPYGEPDEPRKVVDAELRHQPAAVGLDGLGADAEDDGDFLRPLALGEKPQHVLFTAAELILVDLRAAQFACDIAPDHGGAHERLATQGGPDR